MGEAGKKVGEDLASSSTQLTAAADCEAAAERNPSTNNVPARSAQAHAVGKNFLAGGISGATSTVLFQPFDVVKTHIQGSQASPSPRIRDAVRLIIRRQGIFGLWAGTVPAFLRVGLGAGLYFSMLNPVLSLLSTGKLTAASSTENLHKKLPNAVVLGAGALTRSLAAFVVCPITVLKTRMEGTAVRSSVRCPLSKCNKSISIYKPHRGFKRSTRRTFSDWQDSGRSSHMHLNFLAGAIAGASATILTHPPDVVRTKLQLESRQHSSIMTSVHHIYQVHGIRGFFAGVLPRAGRRALHQAFSWTIYEELMRSRQSSRDK